MASALVRIGILLLILSILLVAVLEARSTILHQRVEEYKEQSRDLVLQVGGEIKRKAGSVIEENNINKLALSSMLRIYLRNTENNILSYRYKDGALEVQFEHDGYLTHPHEYIWYRPVQASDNKVVVSVD